MSRNIIKLNLPLAKLKLAQHEDREMVWDIVRKKNIILTPEEWVRQNLIHYLLEHKAYPISLMAVERSLKVNGMTKRTDIMIYSRQGDVRMIVEVKAPGIKLDQAAISQIANYNHDLQADYLLITNGMEHFCFYIDKIKNKMSIIPNIPTWDDLNQI